MAYEYKVVKLDEKALNDYGQAYWEAVGVTDDNVLLKRDTALEAVINGLRDHPPGTTLTALCLCPLSPLSMGILDCYESLKSLGTSDELRSSWFGALTARGHSNGNSEFFEIHKSGRIVFGRIDILNPARPEVVINANVALWVVEQLKVMVDRLNRWEYVDNVGAVLTMNGVRGHFIQTGGFAGDRLSVQMNSAQVYSEASVEEVFADGRSILASRLYGLLRSHLGSPFNRSFDEEGRIRRS